MYELEGNQISENNKNQYDYLYEDIPYKNFKIEKQIDNFDAIHTQAILKAYKQRTKDLIYFVNFFAIMISIISLFLAFITRNYAKFLFYVFFAIMFAILINLVWNAFRSGKGYEKALKNNQYNCYQTSCVDKEKKRKYTTPGGLNSTTDLIFSYWFKGNLYKVHTSVLEYDLMNIGDPIYIIEYGNEQFKMYSEYNLEKIFKMYCD